MKIVKGCLRIAHRILRRVNNAPTTIITVVRIRKLSFVVTLAMAPGALTLLSLLACRFKGQLDDTRGRDDLYLY